MGERPDGSRDQIFIGTLVQGSLLIGVSLTGGRWSDPTGPRKVFVLGAAVIYALSLFLVATATGFAGFVVGMAVGGVGFGLYMAADLALVVDVLPDPDQAAKDLGVLNIAGALPSSIAPAVAPAILAMSGGSYPALFMVAALSALLAGAAIVPVRGVSQPRPSRSGGADLARCGSTSSTRGRRTRSRSGQPAVGRPG